MSLKKYFVNARTKILEFKKKHNLLVKEVPNLIENAIQADKDIISQIKLEYDETANTTTLTFPKGILPLKYYNSSTETELYFDYLNERVVNDHNITNSDWTFEFYNNKVRIIYDSETDTNNLTDYLTFILYNGRVQEDWFNSYYFYFPVTSAGTEVVANPTLAGTESNLTGLQVGNTKYKIPSGGSSGHTLTFDNRDNRGDLRVLYADGTIDSIISSGTYNNVVAILEIHMSGDLNSGIWIDLTNSGARLSKYVSDVETEYSEHVKLLMSDVNVWAQGGGGG